MAKGTKIIIFDDYGDIEKQTGKLNTDSLPNLITIQRIDSVFTINPIIGTGNSGPVFKLDVDTGYINKHLKKIGEGVFLEKNCEIKDFHGIKLWYWNGIVLKKEMPFSDIVYEYATAVDENYKIAADEFSIPTNIKFD